MPERVMCVWPGRDGPIKIHAQKPGAHRWEPDPMCGVRINADWAEYQAMYVDEVDCLRCLRIMGA